MTRALANVLEARATMVAGRFQGVELAAGVKAMLPATGEDIAHYDDPRAVLRARMVLAAAMLLAGVEHMDSIETGGGT